MTCFYLNAHFQGQRVNISFNSILNLELGFTKYKYVGLYTYYSRLPVEISTEKFDKSRLYLPLSQTPFIHLWFSKCSPVCYKLKNIRGDNVF